MEKLADFGVESIDVIIIGSGVGGLSAGSALAQDGKKVIVLEQKENLGGCMHGFREGGYEFHSGVHYVGGAVGNPHSMFGACFDYCTGGKLEWNHTTNEKFDVVESLVVDGEKFDYRMCPDAHFSNVVSDLTAKFPDEEAIIKRHFELVTMVNRYYIPLVATKKSGLMPHLVLEGGLKAVNHFTLGYQDKTFKEVMDELNPSPKLRLHLLFQFLCFGEAEDRASFAIHSLMYAHFAQVEQLILEGHGTDTKVTGVRVQSIQTGEIVELKAPVVISDAGLENTFKTFIPQSYQSQDIIQPYLDLVNDDAINSKTSFNGTLVGLENVPVDLIPKQVLWLFPSWDQQEAHERAMDHENDAAPIVFVNFPSVRDPTYHEKFPGKDAVELLWLARSDDFQEFQDASPRHRGAEYDNRKSHMEKRALEIFFEQFPDLKPYMKFFETFTNLTVKDHLGKRTIYNLGATQKRWKESEQGSRLDPQTPIHGLYLTGTCFVTVLPHAHSWVYPLHP